MAGNLRIGVDLRALVSSPTGTGIYTQALLERLATADDLSFVGLSHRPATAAAALTQLGVELEHQPAPLGVLWQQLVLPRRLARGDLDGFWSPLFTLPLASTLPSVVTVYDLTPMLLPETHRLKVRASILPFLEGSLERARGIVAISRSTADDLIRHYPACREKVEVVYPGIDPAFRPASAAEIGATRASLDCPSGYLLYVGTLEPRKNLGVLLDAWERLADDDAATPPLVLAGPYGWRSRPLLARIAKLEKRGLRLLGHLPRARLVEVVQAASLFVYPSLYEGFGFPPAEAMACGVPVVVSDRSSLPEVVGDAGASFDPGDAEALLRTLEALLSQPQHAAELGARGLARSRRFDWDRSAAEMGEILRTRLR